MSGSIFGNLFQISTWGESHGKGIGVVVDGCPAGLVLNETIVQSYLNRRKPGQNKYATPRKESDQVEILSGIFNGVTTGTPISMLIRNETQRSQDYSEIANYYRPGHADYTFDAKYGFRDYRGGGRSSGRETIGRVAGGAVAAEFLRSLGISIKAYAKEIGPVSINYDNFDINEIQNNPVCMPDAEAASRAQDYLDLMLTERDSVGGIIECIIKGVPAGIGEPVFNKLDANLAKAIMSIGAIKGVEIGDGFEVSQHHGSENNDSFVYDDDHILHKKTNHAGGILGGISDGSDIILRAAVKPTPSIFKTQSTVNRSGENIDINIKGRHDPIIVPRAVVVVETMAALTVADLLLQNMTSRLEKIQEFYKK